MAQGFTALELDAVVSFAVKANWRSRRVIERIGMHYEPESDCDHPLLPADSPLRRHAFYRVTAAEWRKSQGRP